MELPEEVKIFLVEAYENLDSVEQHLVTLEKNPENLQLINSIFRSIHTIKGNCGFLGFKTLETLCHRGEALLDRLRSGALAMTSEIISVLLSTIDKIREILTGIENTGTDEGAEAAAELGRIAGLIG